MNFFNLPQAGFGAKSKRSSPPGLAIFSIAFLFHTLSKK
jgi:hypothetical protein